MGTTTTVRYGHWYDFGEQFRGIWAYIEGSDDTFAEKERQAHLLWEAFYAEVDSRLPTWMDWMASLGEFVYPSDRALDLPDDDQMAELFRDAWADVEARVEQIIAVSPTTDADRQAGLG